MHPRRIEKMYNTTAVVQVMPNEGLTLYVLVFGGSSRSKGGELRHTQRSARFSLEPAPSLQRAFVTPRCLGLHSMAFRGGFRESGIF